MSYTTECTCPLSKAERMRLAAGYRSRVREHRARARVRTLVGVVALSAIMAGVFRAAAALMSGV